MCKIWTILTQLHPNSFHYTKAKISIDGSLMVLILYWSYWIVPAKNIHNLYGHQYLKATHECRFYGGWLITKLCLCWCWKIDILEELNHGNTQKSMTFKWNVYWIQQHSSKYQYTIDSFRQLRQQYEELFACGRTVVVDVFVLGLEMKMMTSIDDVGVFRGCRVITVCVQLNFTLH